jgi:hypothetical protein
MHFTGRAFSLKRLPVELPQKSEASVAIVRLRGRTLSPAAERFIDCVRAVSKSLTSKTSGTNVLKFRR